MSRNQTCVTHWMVCDDNATNTVTLKCYQQRLLSQRNDKKPEGFAANPNSTRKCSEGQQTCGKDEFKDHGIGDDAWPRLSIVLGFTRIYDGLINRRNLHLHVVDGGDEVEWNESGETTEWTLASLFGLKLRSSFDGNFKFLNFNLTSFDSFNWRKFQFQWTSCRPMKAQMMDNEANFVFSQSRIFGFLSCPKSRLEIVEINLKCFNYYYFRYRRR